MSDFIPNIFVKMDTTIQMTQPRNCEIFWNGTICRVKYAPVGEQIVREVSLSKFDDKELLQLVCRKLKLTESTNNIKNMKKCIRGYLDTQSSPYVYSTDSSDTSDTDSRLEFYLSSLKPSSPLDTIFESTNSTEEEEQKVITTFYYFFLNSNLILNPPNDNRCVIIPHVSNASLQTEPIVVESTINVNFYITKK
jgi:hypothetical protein